MAEISELQSMPTFAGLPDDQLVWFLSQAQEVHLKPGETYVRAHDPAVAMFVALEGQLEARGEMNGETFVLTFKPGDVAGLLPFSRMKQSPMTGRAVTESRILRFPATHFPDLVQK